MRCVCCHHRRVFLSIYTARSFLLEKMDNGTLSVVINVVMDSPIADTNRGRINYIVYKISIQKRTDDKDGEGRF